MENFWVYYSLFEPHRGGHAKKQDLKSALEIGSLQFFLSIWNQRRECKEDTMKSMVEGVERAKLEDPYD